MDEGIISVVIGSAGTLILGLIGWLVRSKVSSGRTEGIVVTKLDAVEKDLTYVKTQQKSNAESLGKKIDDALKIEADERKRVESRLNDHIEKTSDEFEKVKAAQVKHEKEVTNSIKSLDIKIDGLANKLTQAVKDSIMSLSDRINGILGKTQNEVKDNAHAIENLQKDIEISELKKQLDSK